MAAYDDAENGSQGLLPGFALAMSPRKRSSVGARDIELGGESKRVKLAEKDSV